MSTVTLSIDDSIEKMKVLNKKNLDEVDMAFDLNSLRVLASRYLLRDEHGDIVESPKQCFERIATLIAIADVLRDPSIYQKEKGIIQYNGDVLMTFKEGLTIGEYKINRYHFEAMKRLYSDLNGAMQMRVTFEEILIMLKNGRLDKYAKNIREYYDLMVNKDFLPNTPTIMNAGAPLGQLSACFVLDVEDNLTSIMQTATDTAMIFKSGGGVGINYSKLRHNGDLVSSTSGVASGPLSFMGITDKVTDVIKQGGKRRGANMGIIEVWHPDIEQFIIAKRTPGVLENFNVSVGTWNDFWEAVRKDGEYELRNPRTKEVVKKVRAREILDLIAVSAWESAEPGLIFLDNVNRHNPLIDVRAGPIVATNPCGEIPLYPSESCVLGSINLGNLVEGNRFNWERYFKIIRIATRFLDNIIDMNKHPLNSIYLAAKETRRIGLGVMGLADALIKMKVAYNSIAGKRFMEWAAEELTYYSMVASIDLAKERGSFGLFEKSGYMNGTIPVDGAYNSFIGTKWLDLREEIKRDGIRNSWNTCVAPTGSISMIAGCSNSIEPTFALVFQKKVAVGNFDYMNTYLEAALKSEGIELDTVIEPIKRNSGSIRNIPGIPDWIKEIFVTSFDLTWKEHVEAQATWQKWVSNAISKTINLPHSATVDDVKQAYLMAHETGCKGITVYRDKSRKAQVLHA